MKCHYCDSPSTKTLVWLKDKKQQPARIELPWCGCSLMTALRKIWASPYPVVQGIDYEVIENNDNRYVPLSSMGLLLEAIKLRCNYIIHTCKNEEEMRAEAKAIIGSIEKVFNDAASHIV